LNEKANQMKNNYIAGSCLQTAAEMFFSFGIGKTFLKRLQTASGAKFLPITWFGQEPVYCGIFQRAMAQYLPIRIN
jgi:hypothetical protein